MAFFIEDSKYQKFFYYSQFFNATKLTQPNVCTTSAWINHWAPLIIPLFCFPPWSFSQLLRLSAGKGRLSKYSFSDAKLPASPAGWRFWCLVSEKNTCLDIPK